MRFLSLSVCVAVPLLVGCSALHLATQGAKISVGESSKTTFGISDTVFEKVGAQLDRPEQIFQKAGYQQLWTAASKAEVSSRLPKGLNVVPKEARVWEPWFRKHLTVNGKQLSTADILKIKWTVIQTVAADPTCQFKAGQLDAEVFKSVESARVKALNSLGLDDSNKVIFQISRADAAFARTKSQRQYVDDQNIDPTLTAIEKNLKRYPTLGELTKKHYGLNCSRSDLEMIYILRGLEKLRPSGLKVGSSYVFRFDKNSAMLPHSLSPVKISVPGGLAASLYYDPTADRDAFAKLDLRLISHDAGPIDRASFECLVNRYCISVKGKQPDQWEKDGVDMVRYTYILGENWPEFGVGNFDYDSTLPEAGFNYPSRLRGSKAFSQYHKGNLPQISTLSNNLDKILSGRF